MQAIWSKRDLTKLDDKLTIEFMECISDLIKSDEVIKLDDFSQHCNTSRLQHSLNVAYYSFLWAKKRGLDYKSVARAGLLHDLYLYDWREKETDEHHAFYHPKEALRNAEKITNLNEIERDAIVHHMWPLCKDTPYSKEAYLVSTVDKLCTIAEVISQIWKAILR